MTKLEDAQPAHCYDKYRNMHRVSKARAKGPLKISLVTVRETAVLAYRFFFQRPLQIYMELGHCLPRENTVLMAFCCSVHTQHCRLS